MVLNSSRGGGGAPDDARQSMLRHHAVCKATCHASLFMRQLSAGHERHGDITRSPPLITAADREVHYRPEHFGSRVLYKMLMTSGEVHAPGNRVLVVSPQA
jgi:hypothetical protein